MKSNAARTWFAVALLALASAALGAPGTPIGGIIVKGGKNPGGQMRTMATTDAAGKFRIRFADGGDYTLEFDASASRDSAARMQAGVQVEYLIQRADELATGARPADAGRHTPFHNKLEQRRMVISVPTGGGELRGTLQVFVPGKDPAARAINESGVSVSPIKPKGAIKK